MQTIERNKEHPMSQLKIGMVALALLGFTSPAWAGRGSSPEAIRLAIDSAPLEFSGAHVSRADCRLFRL